MFEVGDIITAVPNEDGCFEYHMTAGNWVGQVVYIGNGPYAGFIDVETITPRTDEPCVDSPGEMYTVAAKQFRLA